MRYVKIQTPHKVRLTNIIITNIYKSDEGKNNYYAKVKVCDIDDNVKTINNLNEYLQGYRPKNTKLNNICIDGYIRIKFPTHYGRPKYKARKSKGLPTVVEALQNEIKQDMRFDLVIQVQCYVVNESESHVCLQCAELYEI